MLLVKFQLRQMVPTVMALLDCRLNTQTESGKEYSYAAGASTATVDITKLTDADSYVTVL